MWTTAKIRRYINSLDEWQLFTTRDVIGFGMRAAVDQALSRLVKSGFIRRVARGVFTRPGPGEHAYSVFAVARVKAESFGRVIVTHGQDCAEVPGLPASAVKRTIYAVSGRTSSFRFDGKTICLQAASPRRLMTGEGVVGRVLRALWHRGRTGCDWETVVAPALSLLGRRGRLEVFERLNLMPDWLGRMLVPAESRSRACGRIGACGAAALTI